MSEAEAASPDEAGWICPRCQGLNIDEVRCWLCESPMPPELRRAQESKKKVPVDAGGVEEKALAEPRTIQGPLVLIPATLVMLGCLRAGGLLMIAGLALVPAVLTDLAELRTTGVTRGEKSLALMKTLFKVTAVLYAGGMLFFGALVLIAMATCGGLH